MRTLKSYAINHALNWAKFPREHPGPLYFVTGFDKTDAWGINAIYGDYATQAAAIDFTTVNVTGTNVNRTYFRDIHSNQVGRTGPSEFNRDPRESEDMKIMADIATDDLLFSLDAPKGYNQTIFVRGFTISISQRSWIQRLGPMAQLVRPISQLFRSSVKHVKSEPFNRTVEQYRQKGVGINCYHRY